jgi:hypothetical protein
MVHDPASQMVWFFTWLNQVPFAAAWDGMQWTPQALPPNAGQTIGGYLAPDYVNQRVISLHHAFSSASVWNGINAVFTTTPAGAERFGYGCALGAAPGLIADGRPRPGDSGFGIEVTTLAAHAPCVLALGAAAPGQHLGAGCVAWVAQPAVQFLIADAAGRARLRLPLPPINALRGVTLSAQAAVVDPARSVFLGLTFSDGLRIAIGD